MAPKKFVVAGAPASGKGTLCAHLVEEFGVVHVSTGDILREQVEKGSVIGRKARNFIERGLLVPDEIVIDIVVDRLSRRDCELNGWLLDGFPRTYTQAETLSVAGHRPDKFVLLDVDDENAIRRSCGRRIDPQTGISYHLEFNPPPQEVAHRLVQRDDDTEEKIRERLRVFHMNMQRVADHYRNCIVRVNGNQPAADVWEELYAKLTDSGPVEDSELAKTSRMMEIESRLQTLRQELHVPEVFKDASLFKTKKAQQHPMYQTTANQYGAKAVSVHNLPVRWHGKTGDFTKAFHGHTFRNNSLNTYGAHKSYDDFISY